MNGLLVSQQKQTRAERRRITMATMIGLALLAGQAAHAATVTVGDDVACDFSHLSDAVNSVDRGESIEIRLTNDDNGFTADSVLILDRTVTIKGGYSSCSDLTSDPGRRSRIRASNSTQPVVYVSGFASPIPSNVRLESVIIEFGESEFGAGVRIGGDNDVTLSNVIVRSNTAQSAGGGVYIDGSNGATLTIDDNTRVHSNFAGKFGGGLYCVGGQVDFRDGSIDTNQAYLQGGGVVLESCNMTGSSPGTREIANNLADSSDNADSDDFIDGTYQAAGGGLLAFAGSSVNLGSSDSLTLITDNTTYHSDYIFVDSSPINWGARRGFGGGIYARGGGTVVRLQNTHVAGNRSTFGGGMAILGGAVASLSRGENGCLNSADHPGCASLYDNFGEGYLNKDNLCAVYTGSAGHGGGAYVSDGELKLDGVNVVYNRVNYDESCFFDEREEDLANGAAIWINQTGKATISNSLFYANGGGEAKSIIANYGDLSLIHSTLTNNREEVDATIDMLGTDPSAQIYSSIIHQSGVDPIDNSATAAILTGDCVLTNRANDFLNHPGTISNVVQSSSAGLSANYGLNSGSPAIDMCSGDAVAAALLTSLAVKDLVHNERPVTSVSFATPWDAGAIENQLGNNFNFADLGVTITDHDVNVAPGGTMGYTMELTNHGPDSVLGAQIKYELDSQVTTNFSVLPFSSNWNCVKSGNTATCTYLIGLTAGETAPAVVSQFNTPDLKTTLISKVSSILPNAFIDPVDENNRATESTSLGLDVDLRSRVIEESQFAAPGTRSQFRFGLENAGPDAASKPRMTFTFHELAEQIRADSVPSGFTCDDPVQYPSGTWVLICRANSMGVTEKEFLVSSRLPTPFIESEWHVTAEADSGSAELTPADNTATGTSTVATASADLAMEAGGDNTVSVGQLAKFSLLVTNHGPGVAKPPVITGTITGGVMDQLFANGPSGWQCVAETVAPIDSFECLADEDLQVGVDQEFSIQGFLGSASGATLEVHYSITSATSDPNIGPGSNSEAVHTATVVTEPQSDMLFSSSFE